MSFRRLAITAVSAAACVAALFAAPVATAMPLPIPLPQPTVADHLTVIVTDSGAPYLGGTYELECHPSGGTHPNAAAACEQLDSKTRWGADPFAPVPSEANCTQMYGGHESAHITGRWAGRDVEAHFNRVNGCEIARWNKFSEVFSEASDQRATDV
ncbi:SSI family serine proteinase inhibitor [Streptomyces sp. H27-D2]|uniref:SSI family serine proteinase inhibitor n=1 Tax=Streptomyces sp. H27-D2 TaxID=3046304 RepID=UPI002DBE9119|nr:SSI family serine proteinase inhibitor [Streptomyces sp. H27-D2]MEC4018896.1 SSI family serine proteinase inhibitor [Streptomyces sp. H27-D2]